MDPIRDLPQAFQQIQPANRTGTTSPSSFRDTLEALYKEVDTELKEADRKAAEFAVGKSQSLHEIMIASEKAGISFKLLVEIRNKLLDAYQEIMRMSF
ncbi:MAG: flagellar hook-basal body complex protein FliE [Deltaproteobacteria bacterium]|nr:flagellar hook-basal body complex protein FliE [Deltaproteobacteria bacterium]